MTMVDEDRAGRWTELQRLRQDGDWRGALSVCSRLHDPLLLWLQPDLEVLRFIGEAARQHGVRRLISVGCGSGLFEWLLASATGLQVLGLEINRKWWECRYSPPTFLPLMFPDEEDDQGVKSLLLGDESTGLMFCYFNDTAAFLQYLRHFRGGLLVVAGPGAGSPAHCHPQPFSADVPRDWKLCDSARIGSTLDQVAVYAR